MNWQNTALNSLCERQEIIIYGMGFPVDKRANISVIETVRLLLGRTLSVIMIWCKE